MNSSVHIFTFIALVSTCMLAGAANNRHSCAVLTFGAQEDASSGDAGMLANMISVHMARSTEYQPLPRYKLNKLLTKQRFNASAYKNQTAAAMAAGRLLQAEYVIFGTLSSKGGMNESAAYLLEVKSGKIIDKVMVAATGNSAKFRSTASGEIARKLSGGAGHSAPKTFQRVTAAPEQEPPPRRETPVAPTPARTPQVVVPESSATPSASRPFADVLGDFAADTAELASRSWTKFTGALENIDANLELGMRYRALSLKKETDDSFLGSINTLDLENDGIPTELMLTWWIYDDVVGAEVSWFNLRARTVTNPEGFSDGAICVSGPTFAIAGRYNDYAPWIPFGTLGIGIFSVSFDHQAWWQYGYGSVEDWEALGSPSYSMNGKIRDMDMSDSTGLFFVLGVSYQADEQWSAEIAYRRMSLDVDDHYTITTGNGTVVDDRGTTNWPLDNSSWLIGARYSF